MSRSPRNRGDQALDQPADREVRTPGALATLVSCNCGFAEQRGRSGPSLISLRSGPAGADTRSDGGARPAGRTP